MSAPRIDNLWGRVAPRRLHAQETLLCRAAPEWSYSHHAQLACLDGRLFATYSSGRRDEDQLGQRMMLAVSDDLGASWSAPRPLLDSQPGRFGQGVVTSEGVHVHRGRLVAYAGFYDRTYHGMLMYYAAGGRIEHGEHPFIDDAHTRILVSDDAGATWTQRGRIPAFVPNLGPTATRSGRLILPGNVTFPFTDDPAGVDGWRRAGLPRLPPDAVDAPGAFQRACRARGDAGHYCEGSFFQRDDGTLCMMLRTGGPLAVAFSADDGETWSEPHPTDYADAGSRFQFGRLADGRFFGLSNPQPGSVRTPLVLTLSDDGVRFDRHFIVGDAENHLPRTHGVHKYGRYGYPHLIVVDGVCIVIYSINKEDIAVTRFALADLR